jgi:hypothetical protein
MNSWNTYPIELDKPYHWQIGPWRLWLERTSYEWQVATQSKPEGIGADSEPDSAPKPNDLPWRRWMGGAEEDIVHLSPLMPDRPVVARSETPLKIPPGMAGWFYVGIPLWARVAAGEKTRVVLIEEPTSILSKTWFGDPTAGELCYALKTRARREIVPEQEPIDRAICPVKIENAAKTTLDFRRLCLQVDQLKVFQGRTNLWTNDTRVVFQGENVPSRIDYGTGAPKFEESATLLTDSRKPTAQGFLGKSFETLTSFNTLMNLTGLTR